MYMCEVTGFLIPVAQQILQLLSWSGGVSSYTMAHTHSSKTAISTLEGLFGNGQRPGADRFAVILGGGSFDYAHRVPEWRVKTLLLTKAALLWRGRTGSKVALQGWISGDPHFVPS